MYNIFKSVRMSFLSQNDSVTINFHFHYLGYHFLLSHNNHSFARAIKTRYGASLGVRAPYKSGSNLIKTITCKGKLTNFL